jgi:hypothetical protein
MEGSLVAFTGASIAAVGLAALLAWSGVRRYRGVLDVMLIVC